MFKIDYANNITLTRGDSAYIEIELTDEDDYKYALEQGDSLILTVKQNARCANPILQKRFDDINVRIAPKDTQTMSYGSYCYDVQLTTADGDVYTVVGPARFTLCEEVTW